MTTPTISADIHHTALETLKLFRIIFKSTNKHFHAVEKAAGVGGASLWALAEIAETKDLTVSGLSKAMSIHQSTASNLMEKLVTDGYVIRAKNHEDRRIVHLSLTQLGKEVLSKAPQPYRGVLPDALMRLNPETLQALNDHLSQLIVGMDGKSYESAFEPLGQS
ncbi:MarR family transcriptional regulator [Methylotenera sp.]|uniref:MarR family winged helix-turn-helix transcriptional regulator n=1 Tax=Methylotenera sp. TaxID=2051956 RepID=UPI0024893DA4|nr:MarR family transcriptional regulator [Methylotenera sp.]MDI1298546.1 MarR family transcriptional regulator [Methylotenera sp.]